MKFELIVQDSKTGVIYKPYCTSLSWDTSLLEQPGKLEFEYVNSTGWSFNSGSIVRATLDGINMFYGYIFTQKYSDSDIVSVTAYDQMRYLQYKDTMVTAGATSAEIFNAICMKRQLQHKVVHSSTYKVAPSPHDNKSYYEIIQYGLDLTLTNAGSWYMIRDNFGTLEHVNIEQLTTNLIIGDKSLLTGYDYEKSIDSDTYNIIKLTKDNKETVKRDVYIVQDSANIKQWGMLQYYESMDENANEAQIIAKANMLLKLKNRETKKLSLSALGHLGIRAGNSVILSIDALKKESVPHGQLALVSSCTHNIENDKHTMDLELMVI